VRYTCVNHGGEHTPIAGGTGTKEDSDRVRAMNRGTGGDCEARGSKRGMCYVTVSNQPLNTKGARPAVLRQAHVK